MKNWLILILGFVIINAIATDILIAKLWQKSASTPTKTIVETKYIYPTPEPSVIIPSPTLIPQKNIISPKKIRTTTIIPIPGSGSTLDNKWADIAGTEFNFNPLDYSNLKEAYLEVNLKLFNGNGTAFVRLFDVTSGIEVWGSELKTNNQNFTFVTSDKLTLRPGNHLYRIQAKSLTADTTVYNSGRLRLITEN